MASSGTLGSRHGRTTPSDAAGGGAGGGGEAAGGPSAAAVRERHRGAASARNAQIPAGILMVASLIGDCLSGRTGVPSTPGMQEKGWRYRIWGRSHVSIRRGTKSKARAWARAESSEACARTLLCQGYGGFRFVMRREWLAARSRRRKKSRFVMKRDRSEAVDEHGRTAECPAFAAGRERGGETESVAGPQAEFRARDERDAEVRDDVLAFDAAGVEAEAREHQAAVGVEAGIERAVEVFEPEREARGEPVPASPDRGADRGPVPGERKLGVVPRVRRDVVG